MQCVRTCLTWRPHIFADAHAHTHTLVSQVDLWKAVVRSAVPNGFEYRQKLAHYLYENNELPADVTTDVALLQWIESEAWDSEKTGLWKSICADIEYSNSYIVPLFNFTDIHQIKIFSDETTVAFKQLLKGKLEGEVAYFNVSICGCACAWVCAPAVVDLHVTHRLRVIMLPQDLAAAWKKQNDDNARQSHPNAAENASRAEETQRVSQNVDWDLIIREKQAQNVKYVKSVMTTKLDDEMREFDKTNAPGPVDTLRTEFNTAFDKAWEQRGLPPSPDEAAKALHAVQVAHPTPLARALPAHTRRLPPTNDCTPFFCHGSAALTLPSGAGHCHRAAGRLERTTERPHFQHGPRGRQGECLCRRARLLL